MNHRERQFISSILYWEIMTSVSGSAFFGADPDPGLLADPDPIRIQVILMDRAKNFECFTFLKFENPSSGLKVISPQSLVLFFKK